VNGKDAKHCKQDQNSGVIPIVNAVDFLSDQNGISLQLLSPLFISNLVMLLYLLCHLVLFQSVDLF